MRYLILTMVILTGYCFKIPTEFEDPALLSSGVLLTAEKKGKTIHLSGKLPPEITQIELRITSNRNIKISSIKEVSPLNPDPVRQTGLNIKTKGNIWYPVVDIVIERGMEGIAGFKNCRNDSCIINGPFFKTKQAVSQSLVIPSNVLQPWENSVFINSDSCYLNSFYIKKRYPVLTRWFDINIGSLSELWGGTISFHDALTGVELGSKKIEWGSIIPAPFAKGEGLGEDRLLKALEGCVSFTQRSQVKDPCHPSAGGLFLFYDLDARVYRSYHWVWGWGPSVTMLLKASKALPQKASEITNTALEIGEAGLRFIYQDTSSPLNGMLISRWDRSISYKDGYIGAITPADAMFFAGWAWVPLFEITGDDRYLKAAAAQCKITDQQLKNWTLIPHSYYFDEKRWSDWVIDETGFGMEGYAEMFRITGDNVYRDGGRKFIEGHRKILELPDGQWHRLYRYSDSSKSSSTHLTKGMAWAMEGILAANRLLPGEGYLEHAGRMAEEIVKSQYPEGFWTSLYDRPFSEAGITEKGTAIWSYLFYRLYAATGEKKYLNAGKKALTWCLNAQYDSNDPEAYGSLVACNQESGVGYRAWFNVSCTYSTAFMGLAICEELELKKNEDR